MNLPNKNRRIAELIYKYLENTLSNEDRKELNEWVVQSEANRAEFNKLTDRPALLKKYKRYLKNKPDLDAVWKSVHDRIEGNEAPVVRNRFRFSYQLLSVAALLILVVSSVVLWQRLREKRIKEAKEAAMQAIEPADMVKPILTLSDGSTIILGNKDVAELVKEGNTSVAKTGSQLTYHARAGSEVEGSGLMNTISTPRAGQFKVILPDGTKVWLNAFSSIRFPVAFTKDQRIVEVSGELYFEVAKDAQRPFKVVVQPKGTARKCEIEVLGTHFNVNAYPDESYMRTSLLEGRIKLTTKGPDSRETVLTENLEAQVEGDKGVLKIDSVDCTASISWLKGNFRFDRSNIEEIMRIVSRWHKVDVVYLDKPTQEIIVGEVPRDTPLEEFLTRLTNASSSRFVLKDGKILVSKK